jgi:rhomboid protease GluP
MTDESHPAWIDKLANLGGKVGMNATQLRWRLIRWHARRTDTAARPSLAPRPLGQRLGLTGLHAVSFSTLLAVVLMTTYARVWVAQGGGFSSPPGSLLIDFGAQRFGRFGEEPWRMLTAIFLHGGLLHLAFNLIALAQVAPAVETMWGRFSMLFIFVFTGLVASAGSGLMHDSGIGVGASGGLCGLIGAAAGLGHRLGTPRGRELRDGMLKWLAYTIVFGFMVGADNWAHGFGAVAGAAFGFMVPTATWKAATWQPLRAVCGALGVLGILGGVALVMTRSASVPLTDQQMMARICKLYDAGDRQGALALMRQDYELPSGAPLQLDSVTGSCAHGD